MKDKLKVILSIIVLIAVILMLGLIGYGIFWRVTDKTVHPKVTFEIENYGTVKMELYPEYAPNTVANFIRLAEKGFYDGKIVYGKDQMCVYLGRDSAGEVPEVKTSLIFDDIEEGSENDFAYSIKGEFVANGFRQNTLRCDEGVVTLLRDDYTQMVSSLYEESYNSGNSQIAIMMDDSANNLNGSYAAFGKVIEGLDIIKKIYNETPVKTEETTTNTQEAGAESTEATQTEETSNEGIKQFEPAPVIKSVKIDTEGETFDLPEVMEAFDYNSYLSDLLSSYYGGSTTAEQ